MNATAAIRALARLGGLAAFAGLAGCAHMGTSPMASGIPTWDHPLDVRYCRKIVEVSPPTSTMGGFGPAVQAMRAATLANGGTDLLLRRERHDWSLTTGVAYDCRNAPARVHHHRKIVKD